ncbi:hypothetical protein KCP75_05945 [Salmonella enterica subsp. enterica]|nr:hypothetical protein KCP75_05945 [Salmonella enterica subsp. enterica]
MKRKATATPVLYAHTFCTTCTAILPKAALLLGAGGAAANRYAEKLVKQIGTWRSPHDHGLHAA